MPYNYKEEPAHLPLSQEKAESVCPQKELSKAYLLLLKDKYHPQSKAQDLYFPLALNSSPFPRI